MHMYYQDNRAKGSYRIICTCITKTIVQKVPTESYAHVLPRQLCKRFLQNHMHMYYRDNRAKGSYRIICTCITETIVQKVPTESYAHVLQRQSCKSLRFLQNHMHMYYQDNCAKGSYRIICTCITKKIVQKVPTESYAHVLPRQLCKRFLQNHMHMYYQDNRAKA